MKINPNVFIIGQNYHIIVFTSKNSICYLEIGNELIYEKNTGVLPVSKLHRFEIEQTFLNKEKKYTVITKDLVHKQAYDTVFLEERRVEYPFNSPEGENVKFYFVGDIHGNYQEAKKLLKNKKYDLFVFGGDFGEAETVNDILKFNKFLGDITKGSKPIIYVRGNHDARGRLADQVYKYVGMDDNKGYFEFDFGIINGLVIDCGEDKRDDFYIYSKANIFEKYRREETSFIESFRPNPNKVNIAFSHISFCLKKSMHDLFDIENILYKHWANTLNTKDLSMMICAHIHKLLVEQNNDLDKQPHNYPIITPTALYDDNTMSGALFDVSLNEIKITINCTKDKQILKYRFKTK